MRDPDPPSDDPTTTDRTRAPLAGVRVVELAGVGPGPFAAMMLADHGADVVRIDRLEASGLGAPVADAHDIAARGRRSIALDLKSARGLDVARRLIDRADVLIEGWRPGVAERLGLDPAALLARNPRLVVGRMTGYGQHGPLAPVAGHDLTYIALTGALDAIGTEAKPLPPLNLVGDYGGGAMMLAFGVLAALLERERSGRGQVVDAAMVDGTALLMTLFHSLAADGQWRVGERASNLLDGGAPFYATYRCADGGHVAVGALEPKFFATLVARIGLDARWVAAQHDRAQWPALRAALAAHFATRPRDAWVDATAGSDACLVPVLTLDEAPHHPHAVARGAYVDAAGLTQAAPAPRYSRSRTVAPGAPVVAGGATRALLAEAGFDAAEVDALLAAGIAKAAAAPTAGEGTR